MLFSYNFQINVFNFTILIMIQLSKKLILASKSPRRKQLLSEAGFDFEIRTIDADESYPDTMPIDEVAVYIAKKKAIEAKSMIAEDELLITSDTIVVLGENIYEKPKDYDDAVRMLRILSGQKHQVITGVCLWTHEKERLFSETADVYFSELSNDEIDYYVTKYQPYDKAGAYAIQEWIGHCKIDKIEGTYANIMGLPVNRIYKELQYFI